MIILYIFLALVIITLGLGTYISFSIFRPKRWGVEESYLNEVNNGNIDESFMNKYDVQDVYTLSNKLKLHAKWIDNKSDKTMIFMHGHTFTLYGSYKYLPIFLNQNFNVLMPDQRYHGNSEGKFSTLGLKESEDLNNWVTFITDKNPKNRLIGVHGESMGGATVLMAAQNENINFIISDCAFSDFTLQTKELLKRKFKIPSFMVYPAALMSYILFKIPFFKIKPLNYLKNIKKPILLIHGESDQYIDKSHCHELSRIIDNSTIYLCKNADHAKSYSTNPKEYEKKVLDFLEENQIYELK
jgi:hypothetical protein